MCLDKENERLELQARHQEKKRCESQIESQEGKHRIAEHECKNKLQLLESFGIDGTSDNGILNRF